MLTTSITLHRKPKDGTSVTIISKSVTYQISASGTEAPTGSWSDKVVLTTDTKPYLWTRTIVVYSDSNSTTSYSVSYRGKDGDPGKDAVNINLSPSELVYNADKDGNISSTQFNNNTSTVSATRGGNAVSCSTSIVSNDNCEAAIISSNKIKITKITTESVATGKYVPASAGGVKLKVTVDGTDYYSYLPFRVNTNTFVKTVLETDESFQRKYTEISNKYNTISNELNGKASKDELREVSSSIEQTARRISLEVSSNAVGRRNLLVNSDFHNQESLYFSSGTRIECTTGKDGINCVHITSSSENGVYWDGTKSGGMSVVITKGKKYTFSCWVKSSSTSAQFRIRTYSTSDIANASSKTDFYETHWMNVSSPNTWEQFTFTIDTSSAVTNYLAVIFCVTSASDAFICQPMMEEGDTCKGWSRSQQDYDYVGGNMIDNARTLEVGGSLKSLNPNGLPDYERAYYGDSMALRIKNTNANNTYLVMEFATDSMELDVDYIFSFLAKGKANIGLYALCDINAEGDSVFSEDSVNQVTRLLNVRYASIIEIPNQLTTQYKRYWGHMKFHGHLPSKLYIQLNGAGQVYVCQPKLEKGATMTEFTERKTDLVDKASLKKAGIEITTNQIKLYGDKVQVLTRKDGNSEYVEAGMFVNGKLNANLINAETINVNHVYARSSEGASAIGHFGNFDKADAVVGNDKCPLWLGAELAKDAPFRVTSLGDLYSNSGKIGPFWISPPAFRDCLVSGTFDADPDTTKYTSCIKLSKDLIDVVGKDDSTSGDIAGATSMRRVRIGTETKIDDYINPLYVKAWIEGHSSMRTTATAGIIVDSKGAFGNGRAFWARFGSYAGFKRDIYETSYGFNAAYVCCEGYGLVVMNNTQQVTITCPADYDGIEEGSELVIIRNNVNLYFSGQVIQTGNGHVNITSTAKYEIIHLYYLGSKGWYLNFESNY